MHIALGPTDIPHTRRPRARPTPAGRKGSDSLGRQQNSGSLSCFAPYKPFVVSRALRGGRGKEEPNARSRHLETSERCARDSGLHGRQRHPALGWQ